MIRFTFWASWTLIISMKLARQASMVFFSPDNTAA
jgi:hypothetical protein